MLLDIEASFLDLALEMVIFEFVDFDMEEFEAFPILTFRYFYCIVAHLVKGRSLLS
jgi:hypothetical protein